LAVQDFHLLGSYLMVQKSIGASFLMSQALPGATMAIAFQSHIAHLFSEWRLLMNA